MGPVNTIWPTLFSILAKEYRPEECMVYKKVIVGDILVVIQDLRDFIGALTRVYWVYTEDEDV